MTAKNKADELFSKFENSKKACLFHVESLIKHLPPIDSMPPNYGKADESVREYWIEVKKEVEKL